MNGEKITGVTTFFLQQEIDTGKIIFQEKTAIGPEETAGELHDRLKVLGARLVLKTVRAIENEEITVTDQEKLVPNGMILKTAPKIFREDCLIDWSRTVQQVFNQVRGLSPYPGAFGFLRSGEGKTVQIKIFRAMPHQEAKTAIPGSLHTDSKRFLKVACSDGWLEISELQQAGKRRMDIREFLSGTSVNASFMAVSEY